MAHEQGNELGSYEKRRLEYTQKLCHLAASTTERSPGQQWILIAYLKPNAAVEQRQEQDFKGLQDLPRHTLVAAVYLGKNELLTQLLSNKDSDLHGDTVFGGFLECAARAGNNDVLSRFLSSSYVDASAHLRSTLLELAASGGHSSTTNLLLSPHYSIETEGTPYERAIESAAQNGRTDIVIQLADHNTAQSSIKKQAIVHLILSLACYNNHPELILWALSNGADIDRRVDPKKVRLEIPLSWAAWRGHDNIIRLLLSEGANQHASRPHLPLLSAVKYGYASTVRLLIDDHIAKHGGGSYHHFFNEEQLSKHWIHVLFSDAAQRGHSHIMHLFIDLGFDLKRFPKVGETALFQATRKGHHSVVRMLVEEMGVDANGKGGISAPVVIAEKHGRDDIVALLVQLGAKNMVQRLDDGSKVLGRETLRDNSRIRALRGGCPGNYLLDYKEW